MQFWEFEQALKAVYFIVRGLGVYPDTSVLQLYDWRKSKATDGAVCYCC